MRIEAEPGQVRITKIDGSAHGMLSPGEPFEIELAEETETEWMLMPVDDLTPNGEFEFGSQGWRWSSQQDVATVAGDDGNVLRLQGTRRPWGHPSASTELDIPHNWTGALFSFYYRMPEDGTTLRLRVITEDGHETVWQASDQQERFERIWVDLSDYASQTVTLRFEIVTETGGEAGIAEIDRLVLGNVPVLR